MLAAVARERLPLPAAPALAQGQPGEARHQVQLGRPHVAKRHREDLQLAVDDLLRRLGDLSADEIAARTEGGAAAGDAWLTELIASRRAVAARIAGDEFVLLMPDIGQAENLSAIAQKVLAAVVLGARDLESGDPAAPGGGPGLAAGLCAAMARAASGIGSAARVATKAAPLPP